MRNANFNLFAKLVSNRNVAVRWPKKWGYIYFGMLFGVSNAMAQQIIIHNDFKPNTTSFRLITDEDGDPNYDADGAINKIVVWKGNGTVHVINGFFNVAHQYTLRIDPGATVKVAERYRIDNGQLIWLPPSSSSNPGFTASAALGSTAFGVLQINNATITDIRDDSEGGDTNKDGAATTPAGGDQISIRMEFPGSAASFIRDSKLNYVASLTHIGAMQISNNRFFMFGSLSNLGSSACEDYTIFRDAPVIQGNTFEFATSSSGFLLAGSSPIIQDNMFKYAIGWRSFGSYREAIRIGLAACSAGGLQHLAPENGTTVIANNRFEVGAGIFVNMNAGAFSLPPRFSAKIENNTFVGTFAETGRRGFALQLPIQGEVLVRNNQFSNFARSLQIDTLYAANLPSFLNLENNRFENCGATNTPDLAAFYKRDIFVKAENNYWGDPSGPLDKTNVDGLHNSRGLGLEINNGIDYVPFIGGTEGPNRDAIHIVATSTPETPRLPNTKVTVNVAIDKYVLQSASKGKINVLLRDADGVILNPAEVVLDVTAQNHSTSAPPISITVPELTNVITAEVILAPDGGANIISNVERLAVAVPKNNFRVICISAPGSPICIPPFPVRGSKFKVKVEFEYTFTGSNVQVDIDVKERAVGAGTILKSFAPITFSMPPGVNKRGEKEFELDIPLRDVLREPKTELYGKFTAKDESGNSVGKAGGAIPITLNNDLIKIRDFFPLILKSDNTLAPSGKKHYVVGDKPHFFIETKYSVKTGGVNNWQLYIGPDYVLDGNGKVIQRFGSDIPDQQNLSTGKSSDGERIKIFVPDLLQPGARKYRVLARLFVPGQNITVAADSVEAEIHEPAQTVPKVVPSSFTASQIAFTPIPVALNFSFNQNAGAAFAEEFPRPFGTTATATTLAKTNGYYWKFIPLKRYWAVYDTLKDGTFAATVSFTYNPAGDFPTTPGFKEDSLIITGLNPLSGELEVLPTTLNKTTHTLTTTYSKFFQTYVVASKTTVLTTIVSANREAEIPEQFALAQNYPNPFWSGATSRSAGNPSTTIAFSLPRASSVTLKIFDLFGREVATLVDKKFAAGRYDVHWDARGHASGVYFYRLQAGENFVQTKKLLLVK